MSGIGLSQRLRMLADMVTPGSRLVDVGCDHGYLSIYLVREGVCPGALAMDIRKGPLGCAEEHIRESGLGDYIKLRLSDGLTAYVAGEADAMVCAGMGGRLMEKILTDSMEKVRQLKELILQPQSELREFRAFLREAGFMILREEAVREDGKYYFAMKAVPVKEKGLPESGETFLGKEEVLPENGEMLLEQVKALADNRGAGGTRFHSSCNRECDVINGGRTKEEQQLYDMYGNMLLTRRHPVLLEYLLQRQKHLEQLREGLTYAMRNSERAMRRRLELEEEIAAIRAALLFYDLDREPGIGMYNGV